MPKPKGKKGKPQKQKESGAAGKSEDIVVPHTKIYVSNLAGKDLDDTKFREVFRSCGEIVSADLVTTSSQVFGFIEFASVEQAQAAVDTMNGQEDMIVKFAKKSSAPTAGQSKPSNRIEKEDEQDDSEDEEGDEKEAETPTPQAAPAPKFVFSPDARTKKDYTARPVECLQQLVQKATRATSTNECIVYTFEDDDLEGFIATVELILPGVHTTHRGKPEQNKKEAKLSAARVAIFDPEVHRLLPPLPKEVKEAKAVKAEIPEDSDSDSSADESEPESKAVPVVKLSAKQQRQIAKAEQRAKRQEKRKVAKAAKANLADESSEEEDSVAGSDSDGKLSKDEQDGDSDTESDEEDDSSSEDSDDLDLAELEAKKAAIRAKLAAKKATKKPILNGSVQAVIAETKAKAKSAKITAEAVDFKDAEKVKDTRLQANYGQTKFIKP